MLWSQEFDEKMTSKERTVWRAFREMVEHFLDNKWKLRTINRKVDKDL